MISINALRHGFIQCTFFFSPCSTVSLSIWLSLCVVQFYSKWALLYRQRANWTNKIDEWTSELFNEWQPHRAKRINSHEQYAFQLGFRLKRWELPISFQFCFLFIVRFGNSFGIVRGVCVFARDQRDESICGDIAKINVPRLAWKTCTCGRTRFVCDRLFFRLID